MSRMIKLTKGFRATVDDDDYSWLSRYTWHVALQGKHRDTPYVCTDENGHVVRMGRLITGAAEGLVVVYRDRDALNNRRANLQVCTRSECCARAKHIGNVKHKTSKYRGVRKGKTAGTFSVHVAKVDCGTFSCERAAAMTYDVAAVERWGEFASLNLPGKTDKDYIEVHRRVLKEGAMGVPGNSQSGYKGISLHKDTGRWHAFVRVKGVMYSFGYHDTAKEAALVYDAVARKVYGKDHYLNFPDEAIECDLLKGLVALEAIDQDKRYGLREAGKLLGCRMSNVDRMCRLGMLRFKQEKEGCRVRSIKGSILFRYAEKMNVKVWKKFDGLLGDGNG